MAQLKGHITPILVDDKKSLDVLFDPYKPFTRESLRQFYQLQKEQPKHLFQQMKQEPKNKKTLNHDRMKYLSERSELHSNAFTEFVNNITRETKEQNTHENLFPEIFGIYSALYTAFNLKGYDLSYQIFQMYLQIPELSVKLPGKDKSSPILPLEFFLMDLTVTAVNDSKSDQDKKALRLLNKIIEDNKNSFSFRQDYKNLFSALIVLDSIH